MAHIDTKKKLIQGKIVYYGPGLCGKTTNLEYINRTVPAAKEMMSLATEGDRTIFFDYMPMDLGQIRGITTQFKLYTVPGQVRYNQTRKIVLKNVDGVVFVADSQAMMMDPNLESWENLFCNLEEIGVDPKEIPVVLQYNKRDLPNVLPPEELDKALNQAGYTVKLASAIQGTGVVETLETVVSLVLRKFVAAFGEQAARKTPPSEKRVPTPPAAKAANDRPQPQPQPRPQPQPQPQPQPPRPPSPPARLQPPAAPERPPRAPEPVAKERPPVVKEQRPIANEQRPATPQVRAKPAEPLQVIEVVGDELPPGVRAAAARLQAEQDFDDDGTSAKLSLSSRELRLLEGITLRLNELFARQTAEVTKRVDKQLAALKDGSAPAAAPAAQGVMALGAVKAMAREVVDALKAEVPTKKQLEALPTRAELGKLREEMTRLLEPKEKPPRQEPAPDVLKILEELKRDLPARAEQEKLREEVHKLAEEVRGRTDPQATRGLLEEARRGLATHAELESLRATVKQLSEVLPEAVAQIAKHAKDQMQELKAALLSVLAEGRPPLGASGQQSAPAEARSAPEAEPASDKPTAASASDAFAAAGAPGRRKRRATREEVALKSAQAALAGSPNVLKAAAEPKPTDEKPKPADEKPKPADEKPKPADEKPKPADEKPKPTDEKPKPTDEKPKPTDEKPKPTDEKPKPADEKPKPADEKPKPTDEKPKPADEKPKPTDEKPKPADEKPKPADEKPKPADEKPKPTDEKPKPTDEKLERTDSAELQIEEMKPVAEAKPAADAPPLTDEEKNASRIARVMTADLYLYHQNEVIEGVKAGDFHERMKEALEDMRKTYEERVPAEVRQRKDFLKDAIDGFLAKKQREMNLG